MKRHLLIALFLLLAVVLYSSPAYSSSGLELIDFDSKVIDVEYGVVTFSWKMTVKNHTAVSQAVYMEIQFLDEDGYQLFTSNGLGKLNPHEQDTFTDTRMVNVEQYRRATSMNGKISW